MVSSTTVTWHFAIREARRSDLALRYPRGAPEWPDPDVLVDHYARGNCSVLAIAVHQVTGWPLVGVYQTFQKADEAPWHVGCVDPDGHFVDARGIRPFVDVQDEFDSIGVVETRPVDEKDILRRFRRHPVLHLAARERDVAILFRDLSVSSVDRPPNQEAVPCSPRTGI